MGGGCLKARRSIRRVPLAATVSPHPKARRSAHAWARASHVTAREAAKRSREEYRSEARICRSATGWRGACPRARADLRAIGETVAASGHAERHAVFREASAGRSSRSPICKSGAEMV